MDLPLEPSQPLPMPPVPVSDPQPRQQPLLPAFTYILVVAGLYTLLGAVAQVYFLPLGIWWSQILLFITPTVLLLRAKGFQARRFLRFDRLPARGQQLLVVAISVAVFFSASWLMGACEELAPPGWEVDISKILASVHGPWQVVLFASVVIGAPLAEETVFRGYLLPALRQRMGLGLALGVQAVLFSLVHGDPVGFLPRVLLGLVFGCLVTLTGSIWSSVFAHALNNGISTVLFFAYGPGPNSEAAPDDPRTALLLSLGAGLVVLGLVAWLRSITPNEPLAPTEDPDSRTTSPQAAQTLRLAWGWSLTVVFSLAAFAVAAKIVGRL
jgi:hypothetical protein